MLKRVIAHIDMNAFFASVEQKVNPHLKGKPIIVCGNPEGRTVVSTASYEARAYGIKTGMTIGEAKKLCPQAILVECDPAKYIYTSMKLLSIYESFTPKVEAFSVDEAFLDLTGTERLFGPPLEIAKKIKQRIKKELGLLCSVGIASNKLLAKLASDLKKPDGLVFLNDEDVPRILEDLPISELCGIGSKMTSHLNKLGIRTCGDLGRYPREILEEKFGKIGTYLHNMGKGRGDEEVLFYYQSEPIVKMLRIKSMGHSLTLDKDAYSKEIIEKLIFQLSEQVGKRLRRHGYKGRTVCLALRYSDFSTFSKQRTVKRFIDDGKEIFKEAMLIFQELYNNLYGVRLAGVSVSSLIKDTSQLSLFEEERKRQRLLEAMDKINGRFGDFTLAWAKLLNRSNDGNVISPGWRPTKQLGYLN
jgi:DNA polymerase IV